MKKEYLVNHSTWKKYNTLKAAKEAANKEGKFSSVIVNKNNSDEIYLRMSPNAEWKKNVKNWNF